MDLRTSEPPPPSASFGWLAGSSRQSYCLSRMVTGAYGIQCWELQDPTERPHQTSWNVYASFARRAVQVNKRVYWYSPRNERDTMASRSGRYIE